MTDHMALRYEFDIVQYQKVCVAEMLTPSGRRIAKTFKNHGVEGSSAIAAKKWIDDQIDVIREMQEATEVDRKIEIVKRYSDHMSARDAAREFREGILIALRGGVLPAFSDRMMMKAGFGFGKSIESAANSVMLEAMIANNVEIKQAQCCDGKPV